MLVAAYGIAVLFGMPMAVPGDIVLNLGGFAHRDDLVAKNDGTRRLVVLQHGLWRSPWSLWKLERALRDHGYATCAPGYPSTAGTIEQHAARLRQNVDAFVAANGPFDAIAFVGHSMGGLVIEQMLRGEGAPQPYACVYLAVPHRGAILADLRKHWWLFRLVMGSGAAFELSPGDPLHERSIPFLDRSGALVGRKENDNSSIPGDDDGTVAVREASLPGAADQLVLPFGHTAITTADATIEQVLAFLRDGRFARR